MFPALLLIPALLLGAAAYIAAAYWLARMTTDDPADRLRYLFSYQLQLYVVVVGLVMAFEFSMYRASSTLDPLGSVVVGTLEYAALHGGLLAFPLALAAFFVANIIEEAGARIELPRVSLPQRRQQAEEAAEVRQDSVIRIDNRKRRSKSLEV